MASSMLCNMRNIPSTNHSNTPRSYSLLRQPDSPNYLKSNDPSTFTTTTISSQSMSSRVLASVWREIQGCNNWENLVEPLDPLLQDEIIRYGEFVVACYKAFDFDPTSKRYLNCKYGKQTMLRETGLEKTGYEVTKYIYATAPDITNINPFQSTSTAPSSSCGRWIGYVAVSGDKELTKLGRRDIVITFRGTVTNPEWIANLMSSLTPARLDPHHSRPEVKVEAGFLSLYTLNESGCKFGLGSCREQLLTEVSRLLNKYKGEEISITLAGHSMGSSLAHLLAYDIAELGLIDRASYSTSVPVTVFSFGGPRVGNLGFKERCEELGVKVLRVVNVKDPITKLPWVVCNEGFRAGFSCYAHVGVEVLLDFFKMQNPSCVHDLESYISLLKCPKRDHNAVNDLIDKVKGFLVEGTQRIQTIPWRNAALNILNLAQSQWT